MGVRAWVGDKDRLRAPFLFQPSQPVLPFLLRGLGWAVSIPEMPPSHFNHPSLGKDPPTPPTLDLDLGTSCSVPPQGRQPKPMHAQEICDPATSSASVSSGKQQKNLNCSAQKLIFFPCLSSV